MATFQNQRAYQRKNVLARKELIKQKGWLLKKTKTSKFPTNSISNSYKPKSMTEQTTRVRHTKTETLHALLFTANEERTWKISCNFSHKWVRNANTFLQAQDRRRLASKRHSNSIGRTNGLNSKVRLAVIWCKSELHAPIVMTVILSRYGGCAQTDPNKNSLKILAAIPNYCIEWTAVNGVYLRTECEVQN